jgi:hypothetical protein
MKTRVKPGIDFQPTSRDIGAGYWAVPKGYWLFAKPTRGFQAARASRQALSRLRLRDREQAASHASASASTYLPNGREQLNVRDVSALP